MLCKMVDHVPGDVPCELARLNAIQFSGSMIFSIRIANLPFKDTASIHSKMFSLRNCLGFCNSIY